MKYEYGKDEWKDIREKLFGNKRKIKTVYSLSSLLGDGAIYVKIVEHNMITDKGESNKEKRPLDIMSKEPFFYPPEMILDESCSFLGGGIYGKWYHAYYSIGEDGQRFANVNQIVDLIRKYNNGIVI
ncbi:hypothetical protein HYT25_00705 [Candidatus Pacearchaeota archaeon]|nr:hypothetical protein [Candidatus Pacearchaeota archaeon]